MNERGSPALRVAVLGTGLMGVPIAQHLHFAGYDVQVWDIDPGHCEGLAGLGISVNATARGATQAADVIVTTLPDFKVVEDVMAGRQRASEGFKGLWIQSSTVGLEGTRVLAAMAKDAGITYIDCPLLGTKAVAEAGELTALCAGPRAAEARCRHILETFCSRVLWLGEANEGSKLKLVMNGWILGLATLTAEAIALSIGLGFEPATFLTMIRDGPFDVVQARVKGSAMIDGNFVASLPLRLAAKDARLIVAAGEEAGISLLMAEAVAQQLERSRDLGHGDEDYSAVWYAVRPPA
jgi:3-hydroxyisobutyrate dehydrogenase